MKSYIQGMITGGVLVFATLVFMGSGSNGEVGRYVMTEDRKYLTDSMTGEIYADAGEFGWALTTMGVE
jgi:hypothetical protein